MLELEEVVLGRRGKARDARKAGDAIVAIQTPQGQVVALMAKSNDLSRKLELKKRQAAAAAGFH